MLSSELKEKKRRFLQKIYDEFVLCVCEHSLLFSKVRMQEEERRRFLQKLQKAPVLNVRLPRSLFLMVRSRVAEALLLLQEGKHEAAFWPLLSAYNCLGPTYRSMLLKVFDPEHFAFRVSQRKHALKILDLGLFAFRLEPSFAYLHDVAPHLWEMRGDFQPHLAGVLRAIYYFRCYIEAGRKPEEALAGALKVRNEFYETFGDTFIYPSYRQRINELLSPEALDKLSQLLLSFPNWPPDLAR
jgi:hypothetical protein